MNISANPPTNTPIIIALKTLVAANVTAKRIREVKIVRSMPVIISGIALHIQRLPIFPIPTEVTSKTARYTTAIPRATQRKAVETVMIAVKLRMAAVMPTIILAAILKNVQSIFVLQLQLFIFFTSITIYENRGAKVKQTQII